MPTSISLLSGDGYATPFLSVDLVLPDSLASISVGGQLKYVIPGQPPGTLLPIAGTVTEITPTGSGTQYLLVQVATATGVVSSQTSTSAMPTPAAGTIAVAQQTVPSSVAANTVPSLQGGWQLLNQW